MLAQAAEEASSNEDIWKIIFFGSLIMAGVVVSRLGKITATYARLYGFLAIATLGVVLAFSETAEAGRSGAFALLGTVAGYLAGARTTAGSTTTGAGGNAAGEGGTDGDRTELA
jgi:hypothetical protein